MDEDDVREAVRKAGSTKELSALMIEMQRLFLLDQLLVSDFFWVELSSLLIRRDLEIEKEICRKGRLH